MSRIFEWIERITLVLQTVLFATITAAIGGQIFSRKLLNKPLEFPEELSMFLLIASVFIGILVVEKNSSHIKVEFIFERMPEQAKRVIVIFGKALSLAIAIAIICGEIHLFPAIIRLKTMAAKIPYSWLHTVIIVASTLWAIIIVYDIIKSICDKKA